MPLYDYVCTQCGRRTEVMHGIHDESARACEACGGAMKKALSPPAIVFRGSGWAKKERSTAAAKHAKKDGDTGAAAESATAEGSKDRGSKGDEGSKERAGSTGDGSKPAKADTAAPSSSAAGSPSGSGR
jgi:putative FmdB family regulatory protein